MRAQRIPGRRRLLHRQPLPCPLRFGEPPTAVAPVPTRIVPASPTAPELVLGAGHRDVEQAAFLRQGSFGAGGVQRHETLAQADHEHAWPLESLGPMDGAEDDAVGAVTFGGHLFPGVFDEPVPPRSCQIACRPEVAARQLEGDALGPKGLRHDVQLRVGARQHGDM